MQSTVGFHLTELDRNGSPKGVISRGSNLVLFGDECQLLGPTPDGLVYFWLAPGRVECLTVEQLEQQGYTVRDWRENK